MCQLATTLRRDVGVTSYKIWEGTKTTAMMKKLIRMKCPNQHPWVRPERKNHDVSLARRSRVATVADTTLLDGGWLHAIFRLWFHLQPRSIHSHSEWQCLMSIYVNQHILIILFILHLIHELIAICFNWFFESTLPTLDLPHVQQWHHGLILVQQRSASTPKWTFSMKRRNRLWEAVRRGLLTKLHLDPFPLFYAVCCIVWMLKSIEMCSTLAWDRWDGMATLHRAVRSLGAETKHARHVEPALELLEPRE